MSDVSTGERAGETGSARRSEITQPSRAASPHGWMGSFEPIVSELTLRWLATNKNLLAHQLTDHGSSSLMQAADLLAADIDQLTKLQAPASEGAIARTLGAMAEMFQVQVPDQGGLDLYIAALKTMPRPAFIVAREKLIVTHKWPRLPYPADFIEAGRETADRLETVIHVLTRAHNSCLRALSMLR